MKIESYNDAINALKQFETAANNVGAADKKSAIVLSGTGNAVSVSTTDKPGFLGKLFRSDSDKTVNRETRATFMSALKMLLGVSSDKEVETKLGADVLKFSDFNDNKGRPLSAFRIKTIMTKVEDVLKERVSEDVQASVQESDDDIQAQFDEFYRGVKEGSLKAENENLVNGLSKSARRRVEDITGTKSTKSLAEDEKKRIKQEKVQNRPTVTVTDNKDDDVGGIGTALLTPLSKIVGALTNRTEKRVQSIVGQGVNEDELDFQNEIDEN